ncbi:MAG: Cysteine desulfurase, partial [Pseudomonadota bacterium]
MHSDPIFLDNNGTTLLDPRVLEVMLPYLSNQYGNATSRHSFGRAARQALDQAREQVAEACGAHPSQVIFTASGTEADNFAIAGMAGDEQKQIAVSAIEHPAITRPAFSMRAHGHRVGVIAADQFGVVDSYSLEVALEKPTSLISVMLANNETGVIQNIAHLAELAKSKGALIHTDAVQALGKIPVNFDALGVNAMTVSSHKINGPQGAGALILDKRVDIKPLLHGGGQERGLRSGTENVAAIVGFGAACALIKNEMQNRAKITQELRDTLETNLKSLGASIFGDKAARLPNTSFFAFNQIEGETLVMALDRKGFAVASGSACSSDSTEPSHVLMSMGVAPDLARGAVRV